MTTTKIKHPYLVVKNSNLLVEVPLVGNMTTMIYGNTAPDDAQLYLIDDSETSEIEIRKYGYAYPDCRIYGFNQPLENLLNESSVKEIWMQILDYSQTFPDWSKRCDSQELSVKDAVAIAKIVYQYLKGSELKTELETLRSRCKMGSFDWNKLMADLEAEFQQELERRGLTVNPVTQDLDEKLKLDLLALLQESDPIKKIRRRAEICSYFRISKSEVAELLKYINRRTISQETKTYSLDAMFDLESQGLTWVIPEMLPRGETIILAGSPKAGKSLLAIDAAFAIATGESHFLGETVQRGKVLLISCDESLQSTKSKLIKRGFRREDRDFIRVMPSLSIDDLGGLEQELEDFRPDVVIVDSLKRITHGSQISENSAEFADNIYTLKELFAKYNCAGILVHHANKNNEATGVNKLRGSSAIAGAVWGTWQIEHILRRDPNNKKKLVIDPKDPVRVLSVFARDTEGQTLKIEFNPENNSWEKLAVEEDSTELSYRERILNVLRKNSPCDGLSGKEIMHLLGEDGNKSIYSELNRMVNKRLISCKSANTDKRINLYSLPVSQQPQCQGGDSPSPIPIDPIANYYPQTLIKHSFDDGQQISQQIVSDSQQSVEKTNQLTNENPYPVDITTDSQQVMETEGGEGVSQTSVQVANIADIVISAEVQEVMATPAAEIAINEPIKVGDKVLVSHPQANDQGDIVREVGEDWVMVHYLTQKFSLDKVFRL